MFQMQVTMEVKSCPLIRYCQNPLLRLCHPSQFHNILLLLIQHNQHHVLLHHLRIPDNHSYQVITPQLNGDQDLVPRVHRGLPQVSEYRDASMKTIKR